MRYRIEIKDNSTIDQWNLHFETGVRWYALAVFESTCGLSAYPVRLVDTKKCQEDS